MTSRAQKLRSAHIYAGLGSLLVLAAVLGLMWPHLSVFADPVEARRLVESAGGWGPLVFIGLQVVQVFLAPIPGQITGLAGGYLFGTWLGTLYAMIGATIGFTLIFLLVRKLGRPFVERFVDQKHLRRFDYIADTKGAFILFVIFLLPAFPDDLICFIAGLTSIRIRTLIIISVLGRLPGYLVLSLTGSGVADNNVTLVAVIAGAAALASALAFWKRSWIESRFKQLAQKST